VKNADAANNPEPGTARTTPGHALTVDELRHLLAPGDEITTKTGCKVKIVEGEDGSLLFQSQPPVKTPGSVSFLCLCFHQHVTLTPTAIISAGLSRKVSHDSTPVSKEEDKAS
jgi:hypothetical protein